MVLEGAEKEDAVGERLTVAVDSQTAINALQRITSMGRATTEDGPAIGRFMPRQE